MTPGKKDGKQKKSVKQAVLSSSAEEYGESGGEEGSDVDPKPQKQNTWGQAMQCFEKSAGIREYNDTERIMTRYPEKGIPGGDKSDSDISGAGGAKENVKCMKIQC